MTHSKHHYTDRCRCQWGASRTVVVIVIEESGLCLYIPIFDYDYDHDNDKELGSWPTGFCDSNIRPDALNLDSAVEGQEARQTLCVAEDDGFQAHIRRLKTTLSPSLDRLLNRTLDRVHIVDPLRRRIFLPGRD